MSYITREDGEHFVIPSYRDVLSAKQKNVLKRDILLLSQSYGEYITMQKKSADSYEVAFSPDAGYLLGESIWHFFNRPLDMIYCEAIPNTTEAILVIVKAGSVYLDGSFPLDSIPEELVIFLTQQNNFEIYTYGDVPISQTPQEGKFSFEEGAVKSFTVLEDPVFPTLPLLKIYKLQLVDTVLRAQGIGVFPLRQAIIGVGALAALWMAWSYFTAPAEVVVPQEAVVDPYQDYYSILSAPAPDQEVIEFLKAYRTMLTMPGWIMRTVDYTNGSFTASVASNGNSIENLMAWADRNHATVNIKADGIYVGMALGVSPRPIPRKIYTLKLIVARLTDNIAVVYPGNHLQLGEFTNRNVFTDLAITITLDNVSPGLLAMIGEQFKDLPIVLRGMKLTVNEGNLTGSITLEALGS